MDAKLSIDMNDLMRLILQLPEKQRASLRTWLNREEKAPATDLEALLLAAPTMSDAQAKRYEEIREALDKWR
ncbi:MAG: hypothetical protein KBF80_07310 [Flavobacteriales bacterium]|nr:hypothetical protein [Flavobacteriales bacterium]